MSRFPDGSRDRRQFPRAQLRLPVTVVRRNVPLEAQNRVLRLKVLDVSRGGVGAVSSEALETSEPVVVFFPPMGARRGRDTRGDVVRCQEAQDAYRVGIAFSDPWPEHEADRLR